MIDQCAKNGITPPAEYNTEAKVIKALTWNDEKIEKLYRNSLQFQIWILIQGCFWR